jgi:SSS family solute:Na+ symporter/sodium/pantothenate symporter
MQHAWPGSGILSLSEDFDSSANSVGDNVEGHSIPEGIWQRTWGRWLPRGPKYYIGLIVFTMTVVGYTRIGGFLASVWTDLFQSVMMVFGVMLLVFLAVPMAGGLEAASRAAIAATSSEISFGPGYSPAGREVLTPGRAFSMFFVWIFAGFTSLASLVRVMAAQNTEVIRKSIVLLRFYNCLIDIPLIMICIAARSLLPELGAKSDELIPRLSWLVTRDFPWGTGPFVSGLILAAPCGAIMASVSCFVLVIASGLVQDVYLRYLHPAATEKQIRRVTTNAMIAVGVIAVIAVLNPPVYLQALVVLSGSAGAASFMAPILMACYWRRANAYGALAGMLTGFVVYFGIYGCGCAQNWATLHSTTTISQQIPGLLGPDPKIGSAGFFRPDYLLGLDPIIWVMLASSAASITGSLRTSPLPPDVVRRFFERPAAPLYCAGSHPLVINDQGL